MKQTDERQRLTRFNKIMMRMVYCEAEAMPETVRESIAAIDWDNCPIDGLRMSANDMVEMTQDLAGDDLIQIDEFLAKYGAATLSQLRDKGYRRSLALLAHKSLKKEEDVYLLKAIVDNADPKFSPSELARAEQLLDGYDGNV